MRVLLTRRWPGVVERAFADRFSAAHSTDDEPLSREDLKRAMQEFDVLCPTVSDRIDADVINAGDRVKLIPNYGVGYDHIDLAAAKASSILSSESAPP